MSSADLRAQLRVAELEEALVAAKEDGTLTSDLKTELRYARWVARGGPLEEPEKATEAFHVRYAKEG